MAERDFPHASLVEGLRFTAQVAVPNVIQGLLRRRRTAVAAAGRVGADKLAAGFVDGLRRNYGEGPLWIRVAKDEVLLLLGRDAIRHGLEAAPDPFAADPEPKRSAMAHFQPEALTISRGEEWSQRRQFTEAVLQTGEPAHSLAGAFGAVAREEAGRLEGEIGWEEFNEAVRRAARRVILGDAAGEDTELSQMLGELMDKSNPPGSGDDELRTRLQERVDGYAAEAAQGSLAALFAGAPGGTAVHPGGQVVHWLFALGDTLAINAFRCLAVLAADAGARERALADPGYLDACLHEAMRLWPTTPMLAREAVRDTEWDGIPIASGTQLLIVNAFNHRDPEAVDRADEFVPERWREGDAAEDWIFNHFSHGPQGCPGTAVALLVGREMLAEILGGGEVRQLGGTRPEAGAAMPYALDFFALRFVLGAAV